MLTLQTTAVWHDFADLGVKVAFRTVTRGMLRRARIAMLAVLGDETVSSDTERLERSFDAFCESLLTEGVDAWQGVADEAGSALSPSPETIRAALADRVFGEALIVHYARPVWDQDVVKNTSSPGSNGTLSEGMPARGSARSSAKPKAPAKGRNAPAARANTTSTHSKPKKLKRSSIS